LADYAQVNAEKLANLIRQVDILEALASLSKPEPGMTTEFNPKVLGLAAARDHIESPEQPEKDHDEEKIKPEDDQKPRGMNVDR
jgi:hypothetical protein